MSDPSPSSARARAESLFAQRLSADPQASLSSAQLQRALSELVQQHPELEGELREVVSQWRALEALAPLALDEPEVAVSLTRAAEALAPSACQAVLSRLRAGRGFAQRFELGGELGHGGMGVVRRAVDRDLRREVAIKFVRRRVGLTPEQLADALLRLVEEAQVTGQLEHPSIVPVHDLGLDDTGHFYFVMKLVAGRTLEAALREAHERGGWRAALEFALEDLTRVAEAVEYAHRRGVLHRDLKPSNVMVGELGEVYVMDWGLSRSARAFAAPPRAVRSEVRGEDDAAPYTQEGAVLGTPPFMAPELAAGARDAAHVGSDIYALGAMLYHALAGAPPYLDDLTQPVLPRLMAGPPVPLTQIVPQAPAELIAIAERAMARASSERYASAAEFAEELKRFRDGRVVLAHRTGVWPELRKWVARNRALAATGGVAVVAASVGLLAFVSERSAREVEHRAAQRFESQAALVEASRALDRGDLRSATRALPRITEPSRAWERGILEASLESDLGTHVHTDASGAREAVRSIGLRAGGAEVVVVGREGAVRIEGFEREPSNAVALELGGRVERALLHPRGDLLLVAFANESLSLWSLATRAVVRELEPREAPDRASFGALAIDAESGLCAAASRDGLVFVHEIESGAQLRKWRVSDRIVPSIAFVGPDLLCAQIDGQISAWDARSGERRFDLGQLDMNPIIALAAAPDGSLVLSGAADGATSLWDLREQRLIQRWFTGSARVLSAAISPDGLRGAVAADDGGVMLLDLIGRRELGRLPAHEGMVFALAFSAGGEFVVSAGDDGRTRAWAMGELGLSDALYGHQYNVASAAWSPDGQTLATSGDDNALRLWDRRTRRALGVGYMHTNPVWRVTWTPDGAHLITASADRTIGVWRPDGPTLVTLLEGHGHDVSDVAVSPDGATLYSVSSDKTLRRWRTRDWTLIDATDLGRELQALAIDPSGERLAVGSLDGAVELLDAADPRKSLWRIEAVAQAARAPAPPRAVPGASPGAVLAAELPVGHRAGITALAFSPDGARLASTSRDGRTLVWRLDERACEYELVGHKGEVVDVAFHPAGRTLVTAGTDNVGLVWSLETGALTLRLIGHDSQLTGCTFSPDGQVLATTSVDRTARLWDAQPPRELRVRRAREREVRTRLAPQLEELYARLGTTPRVLDELARDSARPAEERELLMDMARTQGDDPLALLALVDEPLFDFNATPAQLELALVRARRSRELNAFHRETPVILAHLLLRLPARDDEQRRERVAEAWQLLELPELNVLAAHKEAGLPLRYFGCRALAALAHGEVDSARQAREGFEQVAVEHWPQLRTELRRFAEWVRASMDG